MFSKFKQSRNSNDQFSETSILLSEREKTLLEKEKHLEEKMRKFEEAVESGHANSSGYLNLTITPHSDLDQIEREDSYISKILSRQEIRNEYRHQAVGLATLVLLILAIIFMSLWIMKLKFG